MDVKGKIMELSTLDGISGREDSVGLALSKMISQDNQKDAFKNYYYGNLKTTKKKVAIYSHLDEVGFFVKSIDESGFIYFQEIGGWWGHVILGQKVRITARANKQVYKGVVGTLPEGSVMDEHVVPISKMYIDLGVINREEVVELGIQIGDMITPDTKAEETQNGQFIMGKALDNRVGCGIMAEVLNTIQDKTYENLEVIGVATAQEEAGTRGSKIAAKVVKGDINLIIDVANGKDTPRASTSKTRILGKGPGICLYDKTALANIELADFLQKTAEKNGISYQFDQFAGGGTDAGSIQLYEGNPTIVLSIPVRYCHSWHSLVSIGDCEKLVTLICCFLEELDKEKELENGQF
ncbi:M42 family metallopeptidase [Enterococcus phoeniculicola]|uniref:M42 glutamyl aminopeptidase n=1 Tax=Enterococcus phoeniculicola ATCC BAA-412 TaxID=1158610 RepID=R3TU03_9ENTE|nr:M42 family peptidase [Enterococcus phoeniculicola]EOL44658.1 hypothetical protein UC3_01475 [Enterococcus phoeniculicola ATCC BAA-412]EOT74947.1 hypothetical protein I589_02547 [Enterococcus phoeniculicola ATCC BAA-412]